MNIAKLNMSKTLGHTNVTFRSTKPESKNQTPLTTAKFEKLFKTNFENIPNNIQAKGQQNIYILAASQLDGSYDLGQLLDKAVEIGLKFTKKGDPAKNVRYYSCILQKYNIISAA